MPDSIFDPANSTIAFTPHTGAGGTTVTKFAGVKDITLPSPDVDDLDETTRDTLTAEANRRSYRPGLIDSGEFGFQVQPGELSDVTQVTGNVAVKGDWVVDYGGVIRMTFAGYIKGQPIEDPMEELGMLDVTVKVSGNVAIAAVPSS
ncbi:MAG: phage tail tube protein [Planctomycetota bacterium]